MAAGKGGGKGGRGAPHSPEVEDEPKEWAALPDNPQFRAKLASYLTLAGNVRQNQTPACSVAVV